MFPYLATWQQAIVAPYLAVLHHFHHGNVGVIIPVRLHHELLTKQLEHLHPEAISAGRW